METQRKLPYHFYEHAFLPNIGGIKYNVEKFDPHRPICGTVRKRHKEACCPHRRARGRANIAAAHRTLRQKSKSFCRWDAVPDTLCALGVWNGSTACSCFPLFKGKCSCHMQNLVFACSLDNLLQ